MTTPHDAALTWVRRGKPVFPCDPESKKPRTPHGFKDATIDEDTIDFWWEKHPDSMVGIPTGKTSGLLVLDFDTDERKGIDATPLMEEMVKAGEIPSDAYRVRTPRGGWHVYLEAPGENVRSRAGVEGVDGFDIRGDGGYVVAAGSVRSDGEQYRADDPDAPIPRAPRSLVARLAKHATTKARTTERQDGEIPEGMRNDRLFREATRLAAAGLRGARLLAALRGINSEMCKPPLPEAEVDSIAERVGDRAEAEGPSPRFDLVAGTAPPSWEPTLIGDLDPGEAGEPIWDRILAKGTITLLAAREKVGKTTLLTMLLRETGRPDGGRLLGLNVCQARVLVVSEEPPLLWSDRGNDDGLPEDLLLIPRPADCPNSILEWDATCDHLARLVERDAIDLVVIDTWAHFVPVESENDNAQVARAARSLGRISAAGAAVLIVHHMSKAGGTRGGTALPAAVETVMEMRRPSTRGSLESESDEDADDGTRIFDIRGRLDSPPRIVATWDGHGYVVEEARTVKHLKTERRRVTLLGVLGRIGEGKLGDIRDAWPKATLPPPSDRTVLRDLESLLDDGRVQVARGGGGANDPKIYRVSSQAPAIPA